MTQGWQIGDRMEGRWEIYNIFEGAAGVVYVVYDHKFREPFAAKTFRDQLFAWSPTIAGRFTQEALTWVNLDAHPNVARARMVETIAAKPYLFLEYVSGGDLKAWIGTPRLTEDLPQVLRFAIQFCDGMIHALAKGIRAHRDVKPQNCLIGADGTLKVTDFGLATVLNDAGPGDPRRAWPPLAGLATSVVTGAVGTCTHMAPEQFDDARHVDVRADVYSFGVMLFQMVTGRFPFEGQSWEELEKQHKTQAAPRLGKSEHSLDTVVQTCLAKEPARRFPDFEKVRAQLAKLYEGQTGKPAPQAARFAELGAIELNNKGSSLANLGRHEEALVCYEKALRMNPHFAEPWFNQGVSLLGLKRVEEAIASFDRALELSPDYEEALSNKGVALKSLGRLNEALDCYERAIQVNPRYPEAWVNKGVALRAMKRLDEALACYDRAVKLNPRDEKAWTNKGNALFAAARHAEALACYQRALDLNPRLDQTWLNHGLALMTVGRYEESLACYDSALALNPRLAQAWFNKGAALADGLQRYREALPCFEEAQRLGAAEAAPAIALCRQALGEK